MDAVLTTDGLGRQSVVDPEVAQKVLTPDEISALQGGALLPGVGSKLRAGGALNTLDEWQAKREAWQRANTAGFLGSGIRGLEQGALGLAGQVASAVSLAGQPLSAVGVPYVEQAGDWARNLLQTKQQEIASLPTDWPRLEQGTAFAGGVAPILAAGLIPGAQPWILPALAGGIGAQTVTNMQDRGYSTPAALARGVANAGLTMATGGLGKSVGGAIKGLVQQMPAAALARGATTALAEGAAGAGLMAGQQAGMNLVEQRPIGEGVLPAAIGGAALGAGLGYFQGRGYTAPNLPPGELPNLADPAYRQAQVDNARLQAAQMPDNASVQARAVSVDGAMKVLEAPLQEVPTTPAAIVTAFERTRPAAPLSERINVQQVIDRAPTNLEEFHAAVREAGATPGEADLLKASAESIQAYWMKAYGRSDPAGFWVREEVPSEVPPTEGGITNAVEEGFKPSDYQQQYPQGGGSGQVPEAGSGNRPVAGAEGQGQVAPPTPQPIQLASIDVRPSRAKTLVFTLTGEQARDLRGVSGKDVAQALFGLREEGLRISYAPTIGGRIVTAKFSSAAMAELAGKRLAELPAEEISARLTTLAIKGAPNAAKLRQMESAKLATTEQSNNVLTDFIDDMRKGGIRPPAVEVQTELGTVARKTSAIGTLEDLGVTTAAKKTFFRAQGKYSAEEAFNRAVGLHLLGRDANIGEFGALLENVFPETVQDAGAAWAAYEERRGGPPVYAATEEAIAAINAAKPPAFTQAFKAANVFEEGDTASVLDTVSRAMKAIYSDADLKVVSESLGIKTEGMAPEQIRAAWTPVIEGEHAKMFEQYLTGTGIPEGPTAEPMQAARDIFRRIYSTAAETGSPPALDPKVIKVFDDITGGQATVAELTKNAEIAALRPPTYGPEKATVLGEALSKFNGETDPGELIRRANWLHERAQAWEGEDPMMAQTLHEGTNAILNHLEQVAMTPGMYEALGVDMPRKPPAPGKAFGEIDYTNPALVQKVAAVRAAVLGDPSLLKEIQGKVVYSGTKWVAPSPTFRQAVNNMLLSDRMQQGGFPSFTPDWVDAVTGFLYDHLSRVASARNAAARRLLDEAVVQQQASTLAAAQKVLASAKKKVEQAVKAGRRDLLPDLMQAQKEAAIAEASAKKAEAAYTARDTLTKSGYPSGQETPESILAEIGVNPVSAEGMARILARSGVKPPRGTSVQGFYETLYGRKKSMLGGVLNLLEQTDPTIPVDSMRYTALHELMHGTVQFTRGTEMGLVLEEYAKTRYPKMSSFWGNTKAARDAQEEVATALAAYPLTGEVPDAWKGTPGEAILKRLGTQMMEDFAGASLVAAQKNPNAVVWYKPWTWISSDEPVASTARAQQQAFQAFAGRMKGNKLALDMATKLLGFEPEIWEAFPTPEPGKPTVTSAPPQGPQPGAPTRPLPGSTSPEQPQGGPTPAPGPETSAGPSAASAGPPAATPAPGPVPQPRYQYRPDTGEAVLDPKYVGGEGAHIGRITLDPVTRAALDQAYKDAPGLFKGKPSYTEAELYGMAEVLRNEPEVLKKAAQDLGPDSPYIAGPVLAQALDHTLFDTIQPLYLVAKKALETGDSAAATTAFQSIEAHLASPLGQLTLTQRTEAGRLLQSFQGSAFMRKKLVDTYLEAQRVFQRRGRDIGSNPVYQKAGAEALRCIEEGNLKGFMNAVKQIEVPSIRDQLMQMYYNGALSGLRLLVHNRLSNFLHHESYGALYTVAAAYDSAMAAAYRVFRPNTPYVREHYFRAAWEYTKAGWDWKAYQALRAEGKKIWKGEWVYDPRMNEDLPMDRVQAEQYNKFNALERSQFGVIQKYAWLFNAPSRYQRVQDFIQGNLGYQRELRYLTYVDAIKAHIQDGSVSVNDYMQRFHGENLTMLGRDLTKLEGAPTGAALRVLKAQKFGRYVVFMSDPGPLLQNLMRIRNTSGAANIFLETQFPFMLTASNIMKRGLEFAPGFNLARALVGAIEAGQGRVPVDWIGEAPTAWQAFKTRAFSPVEMTKSIAGAAFFMGVARALFDSGRLTAGPLSNSVAEDQRRSMNIPDWGVRLPGLGWVSQRWLGVFSIPLGINAAFHQAQYENQSKAAGASDIGANIREIAKDIAFFLGDQLPARNLISSGAAGSQWGQLGRTLTNFVPFAQALRDVNRLFEQTYAGGRPIRSRQQTTLTPSGAIQQTIQEAAWVAPGAPFWGKNYLAPIKLNVWGEEVRVPENIFSAWIQLPVVAEHQYGRLEGEIDRLNRKLGTVWFPQPPNRTISGSAKYGKVTLSNDLYVETVLKAGKEIKKGLLELIASDIYRNASSPETQFRMMDARIDRIKKPILDRAIAEQVRQETMQGLRKAGKFPRPEPAPWTE